MRKIWTLSVLTTAAIAMTACSSGRDILGSEVDASVGSRQASLVIPPDFSMKPPAPGTATQGNEAEALQAMYGGKAPRSAVESDVLAKAGRSDMGIRSSAGDKDTLTINIGTLTQDILRSPEGNNPGVTAGVGG